MKNRTDLNLSEVAYIQIIYHIPVPWRNLLNQVLNHFFLLWLSVNQQLIRISCFQLNDQLMEHILILLSTSNTIIFIFLSRHNSVEFIQLSWIFLKIKVRSIFFLRQCYFCFMPISFWGINIGLTIWSSRNINNSIYGNKTECLIVIRIRRCPISWKFPLHETIDYLLLFF